MKGLPTFTILFVVLLCAQENAAQDSTSRYSVFISPALFVPVSIAVQAGLQYKISRRWQVLVEAAVPAFHPQNDEYEDINYWRTAAELKYNRKQRQSLRSYFSLQVSYLMRTLTDKQEGTVRRKDAVYIYEGATIKSPVLSNTLKIGFEMPLGKRFLIDAFFGAGVRILFNEYQSKNFRLTSIEPPKDNFPLVPEEGWRYDYTLKRLHATAGLRFGIRL